MANSKQQQHVCPLKFSLLVSCSILSFSFSSVPVHALNIGVQLTTSVALNKECSSTCESDYCTVAPLLRYGKYCGLLYTGCSGEKPCDGLDSCCKKHDACVQDHDNDYLSQECSLNFINCMEKFKRGREKTFKGNKCDIDSVISTISLVMDAALLAGRALQKP